MALVRPCVVAQNTPSTSRSVRPASSSARTMPCAMRSIGLISAATAPRSDSAAPTIAAPPLVSPLMSGALRQGEHGIGRFLALGGMHPEPHALADLDGGGIDVFHPAH